MKIQNLFTSGKMNKDLDERLVPQGEYRDALNVRVANSSGSDVGAIENSLSNVVKSSINFGNNASCIGAISDDEDLKIYWFVVSDSGSYICEYDHKTGSSSLLMSDTRIENVLNFNRSNKIQANILTDADNNKKFIYFTDGYNPPRRINISTARGYGDSGFDHDDINVIVKPPIFSPKIKMVSSDAKEENNIEEKFIMFAYAYEYTDGEISPLSPFSEVAFQPKRFNFDFLGAQNNSMVNYYNAVDVTYNTGSRLVKKIIIAFKESGNNNIYIASVVDKIKKGFGDNQEKIHQFKNNSIYRVLPEQEIFRIYDNVPLKAVTQDIIGNRLVYGNYTENYNLVDKEGDNIILDLSSSYNSNRVYEDSPSKTAKSNVDYEIGIAYIDEYGRSTTVLTSENNSVNIPPLAAASSNKLVAQINSKAPSFAKYFRFFVKQSKVSDYDLLSPVAIYRDGEFAWIRLEGDDKNKVKVDEQIIIKSDNNGISKNILKVKILDAAVKEKNFLQDSGYTGVIQEEAGYYIKVNNFGIDISNTDTVTFSAQDFDDSRARGDWRNNFNGENTVYLDGPHFYSYSSNLNDLSASGTFTGTLDKRYEIKVISVSSTDEFVWRSWYVTDDKPSWNGPLSMSTSPILLDDGISVSFGAISGHKVNDLWTLNAKTSLGSSYTDARYAYAQLEGLPVADEEITSRTKINIQIKEYKDAYGSDITGPIINESFYSNMNYDNIEEWFWNEAVDSFLDAGFNIKENIRFRRGVYTDKVDGNNTFTVTGLSSDPLAMIVRSNSAQTEIVVSGIAQINFRSVKMSSEWSFLKRDTTNYVVIETLSSKNNSEVFYEVPGTYNINSCGYHLAKNANDSSQTFNSPASITLDFFNAWTFGNGFECYKIRDAFIADGLSINNRPLSYIDSYRQNNRETSITYSDVYEQSTNYNGLNQFNLSKVNYIDLDDEYGSIQKIHSRDTNLIVFQENKVSQLLYNKSVIFNADGTGNVSQTLNIFGQQVPYVGEYGISRNPHSFAQWGSRIYFADERRGAIIRLSQDGITEISQYGMTDWFRDELAPENDTVILGSYDPFNGQYVVSLKNPTVEWREDSYICGNVSCDIDGIIYLTTSPGITTTTTTTTTTSAPQNCSDSWSPSGYVTLGHGPSELEACSTAASSVDSYYLDTAILATANCISQNSTWNPPSSEWFSDGIVLRYWDGTQFTQYKSC